MTRRFLALFITLCLLSAGWVLFTHKPKARTRNISAKQGTMLKGIPEFFNSNPNAVFLYGYPITEEFTSKDAKRTIFSARPF